LNVSELDLEAAIEMRSSEDGSSEHLMRRPSTHRRICRALLAACIILGPLILMSWFQLCPQAADPACPNVQNPMAAARAFERLGALRLQIFLNLSIAAPYVVPLSYLGLGLLAMRRTPWLATLAIALGWIGSVPWGFVADSMFYFTAASLLHEGAAFARLHGWQGLFSFPQMQLVAGGWVIGHLAAYVVLGVAFWRGRAIPRWAATLFFLAPPLMGPIAYGLNMGTIQVFGYLLVVFGSVPGAIAMLRSDQILL
jgi:hypothetical protein